MGPEAWLFSSQHQHLSVSKGAVPSGPDHLPTHPHASCMDGTAPHTCRYRTPFTEMVKSSLLFSSPTTVSRELHPRQKDGQPVPRPHHLHSECSEQQSVQRSAPYAAKC